VDKGGRAHFEENEGFANLIIFARYLSKMSKFATRRLL